MYFVLHFRGDTVHYGGEDMAAGRDGCRGLALYIVSVLRKQTAGSGTTLYNLRPVPHLLLQPSQTKPPSEDQRPNTWVCSGYFTFISQEVHAEGFRKNCVWNSPPWDTTLDKKNKR